MSQFVPERWSADLLDALKDNIVYNKFVFGPSETLRVPVKWPWWKRALHAAYGRAWKRLVEIGHKSGFLVEGYDEPDSLAEGHGWKTIPNPNYVEPETLTLRIQTKPTEI